MFSQRSAESLGFETVSQIRYDTCREADGGSGSISFPIESPHTHLKIMYKLINQNKL